MRGFTHPASYFAGEGDACKSSRGGGVVTGEDLALFSVDEFSTEMVSSFPAVFYASSKSPSGGKQVERVAANDSESSPFRPLEV